MVARNWKNQAFRYINEERMITDRDRKNINAIMSHPLETDEDLLALNQLVDPEGETEKRADHGLRA